MIKKSVLLTALAIAGFAVTSLAQTVPNYVPTNGLVGWWPFNGNAIDESINTNDGTVNGATLTADRFGNNNLAYFFNGTSNISMSIPQQLSPANSSDYSISCWFSPEQNDVGFFLQLSDNIPLTSNYDFYSSSNQTKSLFAVGHFPQVSSTWAPDSVNINSWINIIAVYRQSIDSVHVFKNGNYWFSASIGNQPPSIGNLTIGSVAGNTQNIIGMLDDIGIWNRALTQQEITSLYNGNVCFQTITVTDTLLINTNLTGFNPVTYQNTIKIWPNPTNDHITIDNGNLANLTGHQIKISNALGQQVFQSAITQQQFYVNMSTWGGNGIYFVNLINAQGVTIETRKIVLQ
jgi:hypothetical protein